ncbi:MAG: hypothetical protein WKG03_00110 [Telluria sp.]
MSNMTLSQFAATLKHVEPLLIARMIHDGLLQSNGRPYQGFVRRNYFPAAENSKRSVDVVLTGKGQIWLARKYPAGCELGVV